MKCLAVIPARGGSKRIPGKNIRPFCGKPIMAYSIEAARSSGLFESVMVSTDDDSVAAVAKEWGADVPFKRSAETSDDRATLAEALVEVISSYEDSGTRFDALCCVLSTAPFVGAADIRRAYQLFETGGYASVFPVVGFGYPIQRALRLAEGRVAMFWPEHRDSRSQDLEPAFHDAGAFYWIRTVPFMSSRTIFMENSGAYEIDEESAQDIDNEQDWKSAEIKFMRRKRG